MKRLTASVILGLASLLPVAHPAAAQAPEVTASEVVDQETLKAFVEYHWDNPAVEGDEDIHSPKLTYAIPIKKPSENPIFSFDPFE